MQTAPLASPVIDHVAIAAAIAADIATRFGHAVDATPIGHNVQRFTEYCSLAIAQDFGVFSMVIASARLKLRMEACSDGTIWVPVDLDYEHPGGGRNGSTIGTYWLRDGVIENFRAN